MDEIVQTIHTKITLNVTIGSYLPSTPVTRLNYQNNVWLNDSTRIKITWLSCCYW